MQKVTGNLDKLHMTEAVEDCIRRNFAQKTDDVRLWCKEKILQADEPITSARTISRKS